MDLTLALILLAFALLLSLAVALLLVAAVNHDAAIRTATRILRKLHERIDKLERRR